MESDFSEKIVYYKKLVRDNIPKIIRKNGEIPVTTTLTNNDDYIDALYKKLFEESEELKKSKSEIDILNEAADVLEVLYSILDFHNISIENVGIKRKEKLATNGGFKNKVFLEYVK